MGRQLTNTKARKASYTHRVDKNYYETSWNDKSAVYQVIKMLYLEFYKFCNSYKEGDEDLIIWLYYSAEMRFVCILYFSIFCVCFILANGR